MSFEHLYVEYIYICLKDVCYIASLYVLITVIGMLT